MQIILVVSDQPDTRKKLCEFYLQAGFNIHAAENSRACFEAVQRFSPAIVILDLHPLPVALETCSILTAKYKLPVLIVTEEADVEPALNAGAADVILTTLPRLVLHRMQQILAMREANTQRALADALRDTASMLNSTLNVEAIFDRILVLIQNLIPSELSSIYMMDPTHQQATTVRTLSFRFPELEKELSTVTLHVNDIEHIRQMVVTKKPLLIADTRDLSSWEEFPPIKWIRSFVSAPIHVEGQVIGFIFVNAEQANSFTPIHCDILEIFANQAGLAIANARLYEARSRYTEELQQEVSKRTAELEQKSSQLEVILESIGEGVQGIIFGKTPQSPVYSFTNSALFDLLGYESHEIVSLTHLKPDDVDSDVFEATTQRVYQAVMDKGLWKGERRLRRKDGRIVDTELVVSRLNSADGRVMGVVTIFRDLKQQKILDAQKTRFVANAAHELRNPIASLKARLYLLEKQPERLDVHMNALERITTQIDNLVEDMLDLARFENGLIRLHDDVIELTSFVRDTILMMESEAESKNVWIIDRLPHEPIFVSIDPTRMMQVIMNLLSNAVKYTPENQAVTVAVRKGEPHTEETGWMVMEIIDTGDGISSEFLPHIFEPFYQVRTGGRGLGLGLAIIKEIIELHGGQISVRSELGKGTTFTVMLKLVDRGVLNAVI